MIVEVNGKLYDGNKKLIMVYLNAKDRENIEKMPEHYRVYAQSPVKEVEGHGITLDHFRQKTNQFKLKCQRLKGSGL